MAASTGQTTTSRRAALEKARESRRPSRLGRPAGAAPGPDFVLDHDAGFPGLLARTWREATAAPSLSAAVNTLLTLGGHVPSDIQLRALTIAEEAALAALFGVSWREGSRHARLTTGSEGPPAFVGELGLTTGGRVALRVPSMGPLAGGEDLVDAVLRVPWSREALEDYRERMRRLLARHSHSVAGCVQWLATMGAPGRDQLLEQLKEAALRTAPFVLYQGRKRYTNFRERNTLTGKTLWPGHPDCALSSLQAIPLGLWSDGDVEAVVSLMLLVRSGGFARIEEANGTQLTIDHVAELLERTRRKYNLVPGGGTIPPATSNDIQPLDDLARALRERRTELGRIVRLYREIHGPLMHKIERVAGPDGDAARHREALLCAALRERLPVTGGTLGELGASITASPGWLSRPSGGFGTGLESLVYETVCAARKAFDADFAMSRGLRSLPQLVQALREQDWARIVGWDLPEFFCCVVPAPQACRYFGHSFARLADAAWSMSARMQYNSWHFIAGNLPKAPEVVARDHFVPPVIPDVAYYSDQHHHGHVATRVRFSIRSPQAVGVLGRIFSGFVDLRLLRCEGLPFDEQDLIAAHRCSAFIASATTQAAALVAAGEDIAVTSFDSSWHWATISAMRGNAMSESRSMDEIREAVAAITGLDPGAIPDDANLLHLGIDSLGMMRLVNRWRREGLRVSFRELIANPTVAAWERYLGTLHEESAS